MKPRRISVRGVIFKDGKLLCVRHRDQDTGEPVAHYATPGGGLERGEALVEGVKRELIEETGVAPKVGKLLFIQQFMTRFGNEEIDFLFHIENPEDYEHVDLTKTTHGLKEIAEIDFIDPTNTAILPSFLTKLDLESHLTSDQPVLIFDNFSE
jgi:8-oxo-dGTP diphosphatase